MTTAAPVSPLHTVLVQLGTELAFVMGAVVIAGTSPEAANAVLCVFVALGIVLAVNVTHGVSARGAAAATGSAAPGPSPATQQPQGGAFGLQ